MHTAICDEIGIEFPIFAFTHCRDVVVAVSKAGGFGVLGAVGFTPEQLEIELAWIDENIGVHIARKILADHGVPIDDSDNDALRLLGWTEATATPQVEVALQHRTSRSSPTRSAPRQRT